MFSKKKNCKTTIYTFYLLINIYIYKYIYIYIYIYIIAEAERKWVPTIKDVLTRTQV